MDEPVLAEIPIYFRARVLTREEYEEMFTPIDPAIVERLSRPETVDAINRRMKEVCSCG